MKVFDGMVHSMHESFHSQSCNVVLTTGYDVMLIEVVIIIFLVGNAVSAVIITITIIIIFHHIIRRRYISHGLFNVGIYNIIIRRHYCCGGDLWQSTRCHWCSNTIDKVNHTTR